MDTFIQPTTQFTMADLRAAITNILSCRNQQLNPNQAEMMVEFLINTHTPSVGDLMTNFDHLVKNSSDVEFQFMAHTLSAAAAFRIALERNSCLPTIAIDSYAHAIDLVPLINPESMCQHMDLVFLQLELTKTLAQNFISQ
ncbi:hypothetical protein DSO57_1022125 [Entomophthora muscae]|uniref:Uncharacterized protein n=1 Tax=Entomophthora muscae TaxID=34485 RepID=A0ACC2SSD9_9FUNG|nr:hypothetical protein DSO57_1022125 [Entomophthora muscae]